MRRIYLAGPDIFHREAVAIGKRKRQICAQHGLVGIYPLDNDAPLPAHGRDRGLEIGRLNEDAMRGCDAIIANLTPFRGPNADDGTAFELGYMRAIGKPVFAYAICAAPYAVRVAANTPLVDMDGLAIEDFDLSHNLMLAHAAIGDVVQIEADGGDPYLRFDAFEVCVERAAAHFSAL